MSRIINRVRGIRGSFAGGKVITTPTNTGKKRGPAQLSSINDLASQLNAVGVGSGGAAGNGVPAGGSDGQVLAKVAGAVAWSFTTAITALGTITTGVWNGAKIGLGFGGTNADLSATGGAHQFLKQASSGAAITVAQVDYSDLSGTQPVNAITQLTGDVTAGPGSGSQAATLATVNLNVGTFGDATHVGQFTVNGKGLITAASNVAISAGGSGTVTSVSMTVPAELSVSGSPVTTSGTLVVTWANENDKTIFSRITAGSGVPSFNDYSAVFDHDLGNTNNKFAMRVGGTWTQAQIADVLTAGAGISLSGTTNVTITNTGASATPGGAQDWIAPIYGGGPPSIMRAFGEQSVDGAAGTGPAGSGAVGCITIQWNTPKQQGHFINWDGARFSSSHVICNNATNINTGNMTASGNPGDTLLELANADGLSTRLVLTNFGVTQGQLASIDLRAARGTCAAPTQLLAGDIIGNLFTTRPMGTGGNFAVDPTARIRAIVLENQDSTHGGTEIRVQTCAVGAVPGTTTDVADFKASGCWFLGTNTNNNASAGQVGEFVEADAAQGSVSLTSTVAANFCSISLTAGDWDVCANAGIRPATGAPTDFKAWISTTSATNPGSPNSGAFVAFTGLTMTVNPVVASVGTIRLSLSATTTVYLSGVATFPNTCTAEGHLRARRIR